MNRLVPLKSVCEVITDGTHYTPANVGQGYPFLTVKDMIAGGLDFQECAFITKEDFELAARAGAVPMRGDVLFSKDGTVGKVHVVTAEKKFAVLSSIAILRPDATKLDSRFLGHALRLPRVLDQAVKRKTGSAIRRIILSDLREVQIPVPVLPEQRRIAAILDEAETLRLKQFRARALIQQLIRSTFIGMFGEPLSDNANWPNHPIGELDIRIADGNYSSKYPSSAEFVDSGIPFLRANNFRDLTLVGDDLRYITPEKHAQLKKGHLIEGDVLITTRGEIGNVAIVPSVFHGANINAQIVLLRPDSSKINFRYLAYLLASPFMRTRLKSYQTGVALKQLPIRMLIKVPIPVPPIELQNQFAEKAAKIENLKRLTLESLKKIELLFTSLQDRAFRGEL